MTEPIDQRIGSRFFNRPFVQISLSLILLLGALLCVLPSGKWLITNWAAEHALQFMLFYLALGFLFLFLDRGRLMFVSFICCGLLSLYLKNRTEEVVGMPRLSEDIPVVKIAQLNTSSWGNDVEDVLSALNDLEADLISIQEVNLFWDSILLRHLPPLYPYHHSWAKPGIFGASLYSKRPLMMREAVYYKESPALRGIMEMPFDQRGLSFIGLHAYPLVGKGEYPNLSAHLEQVATSASFSKRPLVIFGDFGTVPWTNEILSFKSGLGLKDSRRGFLPTYNDGSLSLLNVPHDHIFYSDELQCIDFQNLSTGQSNTLGIIAVFQLIPESE